MCSYRYIIISITLYLVALKKLKEADVTLKLLKRNYVMVNIANNVAGTTLYAGDLQQEQVIYLLDENKDTRFDWLWDNYLKKNPGRCDFLANICGNIPLNAKNKIISKNSIQKLLWISFSRSFSFDNCVDSLCRRASQKLA